MSEDITPKKVIDDGGFVYSSFGMWKDASGAFDGAYVNTPKKNGLTYYQDFGKIQIASSWDTSKYNISPVSPG